MYRFHFGSSATHADQIEFKQIKNQLHGGLSCAGGEKNFVGYDACSGPVIWDGSDLQQGFLGQGRCGQKEQLSLAWGRCLGDSEEITTKLEKTQPNQS